MLRLSQKAWNNVVIFAMLFMVYLFTLSNDMLNDGDAGTVQRTPVFPPYSVLMSIDFGFVSLQRIGQDWRVAGGSLEQLGRLTAIADNWARQEAVPMQFVLNSSPFIVTVQLAGEDKKRVYQLYPSEQQVLLVQGAQQWVLPDVSIKHLFPVELLSDVVSGDIPKETQQETQ